MNFFERNASQKLKFFVDKNQPLGGVDGGILVFGDDHQRLRFNGDATGGTVTPVALAALDYA